MQLYSMKEIWTTLKWIGINNFKSLNKDGVYDTKVGSNPGKRMKRWG
ncbi:hypothetical protein [Domibacillus antri]|nr:hypothetical protein [Domibacillus antri]